MYGIKPMQKDKIDGIKSFSFNKLQKPRSRWDVIHPSLIHSNFESESLIERGFSISDHIYK